MSRKFKILLVVSNLLVLLVLTVSSALATFTIGWWKNKGLNKWDESGDIIVVNVAPGATGCNGTGFYAGLMYPYQVAGRTLTYLDILKSANASDASLMLAAQTIAAQLNIAQGACNAFGGNIQALVSLANDFLVINPVGSDPQGADRDYALALKDCLDLHNNLENGDPNYGTDLSPAYVCAKDLLGLP